MHSSLRRPALALCASLLAVVPAARADTLLLFDDFDGPALNTSTWGLATWNIGDRTSFGNQPVFASDGTDNFVRLPLDTYNPSQPGQRVLGTEIYSLQNFGPDPEGIEYVARARLNESQGGLVAAFFTYNQRRVKGRWLSDEIDFEVLSNWDFDRILVTSWDDWGAPGSDYEDGVHHLGASPTVADFDWTDWNTYAMRWYPDRVEWWINGSLIHDQSAPVPDMAQPVRASLWAGGTTWPDAFDATLAPVTSTAANRRFHWDVDYIAVRSLGGGGGGSQPPAAPSGLAAQVTGNQVLITWADNAVNEETFIVYRAWKPKGKAAPDFQVVAQLGPDVTLHTDVAPDGQHLYRVSAANAAGESAPSNTVEVTVGSGGRGR